MNPSDLIVPSYLRVLEAEQTLVNNFVYEEENQLLAAHLLKGGSNMNIASGKRLDESSEAEADNENSIP